MNTVDIPVSLTGSVVLYDPTDDDHTTFANNSDNSRTYIILDDQYINTSFQLVTDALLDQNVYDPALVHSVGIDEITLSIHAITLSDDSYWNDEDWRYEIQWKYDNDDFTTNPDSFTTLEYTPPGCVVNSNFPPIGRLNRSYDVGNAITGLDLLAIYGSGAIKVTTENSEGVQTSESYQSYLHGEYTSMGYTAALTINGLDSDRQIYARLKIFNDTIRYSMISNIINVKTLPIELNSIDALDHTWDSRLGIYNHPDYNIYTAGFDSLIKFNVFTFSFEMFLHKYTAFGGMFRPSPTVQFIFLFPLLDMRKIICYVNLGSLTSLKLRIAIIDQNGYYQRTEINLEIGETHHEVPYWALFTFHYNPIDGHRIFMKKLSESEPKQLIHDNGTDGSEISPDGVTIVTTHNIQDNPPLTFGIDASLEQPQIDIYCAYVKFRNLIMHITNLTVDNIINVANGTPPTDPTVAVDFSVPIDSATVPPVTYATTERSYPAGDNLILWTTSYRFNGFNITQS